MKNNIKKIRLTKGLLQKQLAEKMGCNQNDISRWESGERTPSTENLSKIAEALGCSVNDLITSDENYDSDFNSAIECGKETARRLDKRKVAVYRKKLSDSLLSKDYDAVLETILQLGGEAQMEYPFFYSIIKEYSSSGEINGSKKYVYAFLNTLSTKDD